MPFLRGVVCCLMMLGLAGQVSGSTSRSVTTADLYAAERIIAQNADSDEQVEVLSDALSEVFSRVTGRLDLPDDPVLAESLEQPQELMNQFSLGDSDVTVPDAIGNPLPTYRLSVDFSPSQVRDALARAGVPVWGVLRPRLTLVVAGPKEGEIALLEAGNPTVSGPDISPEDDVPAYERIRRSAADTARGLGLPVLWPVLDLQDLDRVTPSDLWLGEPDAMQALNERYGTGGVIAGYVGIDQESGRWVGRWYLLTQGERVSATFFGESETDVVERGLGMVARRLSDRYAVDFSRSEPYVRRVEVRGVNDFNAYADVRRYLAGLSGSARVDPVTLSRDRATYRLETRADEDTLRALLALEGRLLPVEGDGWADRLLRPVDLRVAWQPETDDGN